MKVLTTPRVRAAMDDETRAYLDQMKPALDGASLSLIQDGRGLFIANLSVNGTHYRREGATLRSVIAQCVVAVAEWPAA